MDLFSPFACGRNLPWSSSDEEGSALSRHCCGVVYKFGKRFRGECVCVFLRRVLFFFIFLLLGIVAVRFMCTHRCDNVAGDLCRINDPWYEAAARDINRLK